MPLADRRWGRRGSPIRRWPSGSDRVPSPCSFDIILAEREQGLRQLAIGQLASQPAAPRGLFEQEFPTVFHSFGKRLDLDQVPFFLPLMDSVVGNLRRFAVEYLDSLAMMWYISNISE